MNCSNCGTSMPADAEFCPNCGQSVKAKATKRPVGGTSSGLGTIAPMRESRASVLEPGTRFAERYEVIRKLGEGGMGVVYVARDTNTGEEMVLKLIHPDLVTGEEAVKRLMAEGLMARQIRHPNIVAVYDVSQYNGQPYFTMEFVKGGTLRSWLVNGISAGREVSLQTAGGLMKSMLAGLSEAHRMGVVHRDKVHYPLVVAAATTISRSSTSGSPRRSGPRRRRAVAAARSERRSTWRPSR